MLSKLKINFQKTFDVIFIIIIIFITIIIIILIIFAQNIDLCFGEKIRKIGIHLHILVFLYKGGV